MYRIPTYIYIPLCIPPQCALAHTHTHTTGNTSLVPGTLTLSTRSRLRCPQAPEKDAGKPQRYITTYNPNLSGNQSWLTLASDAGPVANNVTNRDVCSPGIYYIGYVNAAKGINMKLITWGVRGDMKGVSQVCLDGCGCGCGLVRWVGCVRSFEEGDRR